MQALEEFWEYCKNNQVKIAQDYILSRKFGLNNFEWGYFSNNKESQDLLTKYPKEYKDLTIGLILNNEVKSFFFDRLIFPIKDISGNIIAVAGRPITDPCPKPKYYNSSYDKKYNLFYLNEAIPHIRKQKFVFVVEGYFAALRLHHTCNIKNVVATCGTLFTRGQIDSLSRYTSNIAILRDNDDAGENSTNKVIEKFKGMEHLNIFSVKIDTTGDDPDDYIVKYGKEKFVELIKPQLIFK